MRVYSHVVKTGVKNPCRNALLQWALYSSIWILFLSSAGPCLAEISLNQNYVGQLLSRAEEYIVNDTTYRAKEAIVDLIQELRRSSTYSELGSDDLGIKFV